MCFVPDYSSAKQPSLSERLMPNNSQVRGPAPQPCASCPYRRDVASGIWAAEEYAKLPAYDTDTPFQPANLFLCHQTSAGDPRARVCAGWVGCHGSDLLALRLAASRGIVDGRRPGHQQNDLGATVQLRRRRRSPRHHRHRHPKRRGT